MLGDWFFARLWLRRPDFVTVFTLGLRRVEDKDNTSSCLIGPEKSCPRSCVMGLTAALVPRRGLERMSLSHEAMPEGVGCQGTLAAPPVSILEIHQTGERVVATRWGVKSASCP